jgi:small-conductance mechanosensitive channel
VKVTNSRDVFLRQFHIPAVSSLTAILAMIFVIHYDKWFPNALDVSSLARTLQYAGIAFLVGTLLIYLLTTVYLKELTVGFNRLVTYNDEISKFKFRHRIS